MAKLSIITDPVTKQQFARDTDVAGSIYSAYTPPAAAAPASPVPAPAAAPVALTMAPAAAPIAAPAQAAGTASATAPQAPAVVDPKQLAASANQEALGLYQQTKDRDIDIRESQKVIRDLTAKITGDAATPPPRPPSMMEMFAQQRRQLGLEPLETQLAGIDSEIDRINTTAFTDADRASDQPLGMRAIGTKQGAIGREAQRQVALLQVERSAVARQVANKTATLQMVMDFTQQDFSNASQAYGQEFDRNVQTLNLLNAQQDREETAQDKLQQNATANLQTIWNTMKDSGASFDSLSDSQRNAINQMEMQAGLPTGFFQSLPAIVPEQKILSTTTRDNGGIKYADVLTQDPATGAISVQTLRLGGISSGSSGSGAASSPLADAVMSNPELFNQLTPTQKGNLAPILAARGFNAFGKPLSDTAIAAISQTDTAVTALTDLKAKIEGHADQLGPITGFAALNPWSDARKLQADVDRVRQTVGKALEGGVLRKEDEDKYKKILATLNDTPETAVYKIDALIGSLQSNIENYKTLQAATGHTDLSQPSSSPEDLRAKYNY